MRKTRRREAKTANFQQSSFRVPGHESRNACYGWPENNRAGQLGLAYVHAAVLRLRIVGCVYAPYLFP
jgi:hypothetical protein